MVTYLELGMLNVLRSSLPSSIIVWFYSREVYFPSGKDNTKISGMAAFQKGVDEYGWPLRVRGDQGGENYDVCMAMQIVQGIDTSAFIAGKSTHNQRIERLWRDMSNGCMRTFYEVFKKMKNDLMH